jgi:hypothetical protein
MSAIGPVSPRGFFDTVQPLDKGLAEHVGRIAIPDVPKMTEKKHTVAGVIGGGLG